jgi:RimJ/RimL family protein N-acetyltransferase
MDDTSRPDRVHHAAVDDPVMHGQGELGPSLSTERLVLRRWRPADLAPFADMNADPVVMQHMARTLTRTDSDAFVGRIEAEFEACGFGLWAVEIPGTAPFIGYVGLHRVPFDAPFTPAVEVGWRLALQFWGHGYATEAARAAVRYGYEEVGLDEIVSFTTPGNVAAWKVMERLGMRRDPSSDFAHPELPAGHPLRWHVFYRFPPR